MKMDLKIIASLFFSCVVLLLLTACNVEEETGALVTMEDNDRVWVFIQFNVPEEGDKIDGYYYYGRVSKRQYSAISANKLTSGFILLKDTRYWGNDDIIHAYADFEDTGDLVFRIEDIRYIRLMRAEPKVGMGAEQWEQAEEEAEAKLENPENEADTEAESSSESKVSGSEIKG